MKSSSNSRRESETENFGLSLSSPVVDSPETPLAGRSFVAGEELGFKTSP
ncbi:hypothetical protein Hanom_Chr12g01091641 [Helianthus anomalus]